MRKRGWKRWIGAAIALVAVLGAADPERGPSEIDRWSEGPVRWLLQPSELRELRKLDSVADAVQFIAQFWARRDPDPATEDNAFRDQFYQRVESADLLYPEEDKPGSLTDRGRALILLGPPDGLKISSRPSLKWDSRPDRRRKVRVLEVPLEIWTYRIGYLPPVLAAATADLGEDNDLRLTFVVLPERTYLAEGSDFLDLAARVALARPH